ncbi:hypothetical protein TCAL_16791 [Tigriopus californicus]|uniref:Uncharacterized protein n=1 Tax=Tigriopus californicus TaxID=6832 RepID=A0A553PT98_TIGCA|nr:hypothetical protein TCAL_16791 [Tigriopus californicus]
MSSFGESLNGNWSLVEYIASFDGKPIPPHNPYLCPESRMVWSPNANMDGMNVSQVSIEWPRIYQDVVQWTQHHNKSGVFFHEENVFSLWTMKIMEVVPDSHMLVFFCIDYTIWPGWNHRGFYILKRDPLSNQRVRRRLSKAAHRRMRIQYHR